MINQLIRYEPALRLIKQAGYKKICEIGSGQNGICKFLDQEIVGVDIDFKDYQEDVKINIHPNLLPIRGDILEGTRFVDQEFDLVICVDMLEHIHKSDRERAIKEILRIGKNAYIALPVGKYALACDRWLGDFMKKRGKVPPGWLYEHLDLEFPLDGEIERILDSNHQITFRILPNDNITFHKIVVLIEFFRFGRASDRLSRWKMVRPLMRPFNSGKTYRCIYLVSGMASSQDGSLDKTTRSLSPPGDPSLPGTFSCG